MVSQVIPHIMEQKIGVGIDSLMGQGRNETIARSHRGTVALGAARFIKQAVSVLYLWPIEIARRRNTQGLTVERDSV